MTKKEIGFSLNNVDSSTVLVKEIPFKKGSKKSMAKRERRNPKLSLHLFDEEYIEHLYQLEVELVKSQKTVMDSFRDIMGQTVKVLMK